MEDQEIVELLKDPEKLLCVIHCLSKIKNLDEVIREHGDMTVFRIACEATKEAFGGEAL